MTEQQRREPDVAVVGGGLVGAAIAWGLARAGQTVTVLDEGDVAVRPSRGNFALVWVQSKGLGMPAYAAWTRRSSDSWSELAALLKEQTGLDVCFQRPGGIVPALSEDELERRAHTLEKLKNQPGMGPFEYEILDHNKLAKLLPQIGPEVAGASYCPLDGHANSLRLLRALHIGLDRLGATYLPHHRTLAVAPHAGGFRLETTAGEVRAGKVVLAAGHDNGRLASMVGLTVPVRPQRGQIIVTEKVAPFLSYPLSTIRQTDEGGVMIGDSVEEAGFDDRTGTGVLSVMADRAVRILPLLASLRVIRTWAALRVMSQDGFPIYEQSASAPGAFVATCHSGVTLAANHALALAPQIVDGRLDAGLDVFSSRRFDVSKAA